MTANPFFILFLGLLTFFGYGTQAGLLVATLALHELAHLAAARTLGLSIPRLELYPFGGSAAIEGMGRIEPLSEALVALAGPMQNLILVAIAYALSPVGWFDLGRVHIFISMNLSMALFNLLPALPLDGGRVMRAMLAERWGLRLATVRMQWLGRVLAILATASGVAMIATRLGGLDLTVLGGFLLLSASRERAPDALSFWRNLERKRAVLLRNGILYEQGVVALDTVKLKDVLHVLVPRRYHQVWVTDQRLRFLGSLAEEQLMDAAFRFGHSATLGELLVRYQPPSVPPSGKT